MSTISAAPTAFRNIINGELRESDQNSHGIDPRTEDKLWAFPIASSQDLDDAVKAAQDAFPKWAETNIQHRQKVLLDLAELLNREKKLISGIVSKETGKSRHMGELEVEHSIGFLKFNASQSLPDEVLHEDEHMKIISTHYPIGVVGAICPWNFPLVLATAKIAAALVMGNCIVVKPSPFTPYSVLKFAELATGIVPKGVFQALNGDNKIGELMTLHPDIQKISFTGSTSTGKKIVEGASKTLKRLTLELGGNDATIVFPDVSVDEVASQVALGCLFNSGQMCVATKRIYVHEDIHERFKHSLVRAVRGLSQSRHAESSIFGPLQNKMQHSIIRNLIKVSKEEGHDFAFEENQPEHGFFINPVVINCPPDSSDLVQGEQFGPIIPLLSWKTEDEVIKRANGTNEGLGACVWAKDARKAEAFGRKLEAGSVWVNSFEKPHPAGYFSGHKQSGIGGEWGKQGLLSYCNTQSIHVYKSAREGGNSSSL